MEQGTAGGMLAYIFTQRSQHKHHPSRASSGQGTRRGEGSALQPQHTVRWELRSILLPAQKGTAGSQNASAASLSWPWCMWGFTLSSNPKSLVVSVSSRVTELSVPTPPRLTNKWHFLPHSPLPAPQSCKHQFNLSE